MDRYGHSTLCPYRSNFKLKTKHHAQRTKYISLCLYRRHFEA